MWNKIPADGGEEGLEMSQEKAFGMPVDKGRWGYLVLGALINICLGSVYAFSVFREPLEELWGISATHSGVPFMVFLAMFAAGMVVAGRWIDRWGPRKTGIIGGVMVGGGWLLAGFSPNIAALTVLYGVIGGAGVGVAYGCPIAVAARWFPDRKGLAVGLALMGFGLSALIVAPLLEAAIRSFGALPTFSLFGTVFLILLVLFSLPLRVPPEGFQPRSATASGRRQGARTDMAPAEMLRNGTFYALWGCFVLGCLAGLMAIGIAAPFGREVAGLDPPGAAAAVSLFALFNAGGRPLFGWLADALTPKRAALLSFVLIAGASLLLVTMAEGNPIVYFVGFAILWLNLGGWLAIAPAATATFFGTKHYAGNYGWVYSGYGVGAILGMTLSGAIRDITGSYLMVFPPVIGLAVVGLAVALAGLDPSIARTAQTEEAPAAARRET